jgi:hypothetical protein
VPRRLLARCLPDCICEFRAASRQRFDDAATLAGQGRRTAAIYLWGYAAEMLPKAAYFTLVGLGETAPITVAGQIRPAIIRGRSFGIAWPPQGEGHNVRAWAELLVVERALQPATAYAPAFGRQLQRYGQRLELLWRETLRYHKNIAYPHEVAQVRAAAEWLLSNADNL